MAEKLKAESDRASAEVSAGAKDERAPARLSCFVTEWYKPLI
jgi:hypothetical protein